MDPRLPIATGPQVPASREDDEGELQELREMLAERGNLTLASVCIISGRASPARESGSALPLFWTLCWPWPVLVAMGQPVSSTGFALHASRLSPGHGQPQRCDENAGPQL
jgi:hypothetical protein